MVGGSCDYHTQMQTYHSYVLLFIFRAMLIVHQAFSYMKSAQEKNNYDSQRTTINTITTTASNEKKTDRGATTTTDRAKNDMNCTTNKCISQSKKRLYVYLVFGGLF